MRRACAAVLVLAMATVLAPAVRAQPRAPITITQPSGHQFGPVVMAVIEQQRARPTSGYYCPDDLAPDAVCISASIVEGPVRIIQLLSAPPENWRPPGPRPRIRFLAGHAVRSVAPQRRLAIMEQTENGYYWLAWSAPVTRGHACIPDDVMTQFGIATTAASPLRLRSLHGNANCLTLRAAR